MAVIAFEGPAGTGKTHSLMDRLQEDVPDRLLIPHQQVLALTFMHGSRRRLDSRLREIEALAGRFQATTVDSFAWRLAQRWRMLAASLGYAIPAEGQYDETCALAAALMARPAVASWLAVSYPIILVDEAQDLSSARSMMIAGVVQVCQVLLAFDEFQCLDPGLRPMPIQNWLPAVCVPTSLTVCRRTNNAELLQAARAVRNGAAIQLQGRRFKVALTPTPPLAATFLANAIAWRAGGGSVAVLTPSRRGGFANAIVALVSTRTLGNQRNGPFNIEWESSDEMECNALCDRLAIPESCSVPDAIAALEPHGRVPVVKAPKDWISLQRRILGIEEITADQVRRQIGRIFAARRRYGARPARDFIAMTIQQAKNREFDHVVVVWPYTIPNDNEQKRRLLYNAITRARRSCLVLVQARELLDAPPFVPQEDPS
jgi:hypothetical protein